MRHFVEELEQLKTKLLEMSSLVEAAIQRSISAVIQKDRSAAEEVFRNEARINEIEIEIDEFAINLLALQQPMAADLRLIVAALKINTDLERMGDLAVNIAQRAHVADGRAGHQADDRYSAHRGPGAIHGAQGLDAFVARDADLARSVLASDDAVDSLRTRVLPRAGQLHGEGSAEYPPGPGSAGDYAQPGAHRGSFHQYRRGRAVPGEGHRRPASRGSAVVMPAKCHSQNRNQYVTHDRLLCG